jgi:uncharacterized HAD superfamily protein
MNTNRSFAKGLTHNLLTVYHIYRKININEWQMKKLSDQTICKINRRIKIIDLIKEKFLETKELTQVLNWTSD